MSVPASPHLTYTRREALRLGGYGIAGAMLVAALGACDLPSKSQLKFMNWQDYIDPHILEAFTEQSKLTVSYTTYASNDELEERLALAGVVRTGGRKSTSYDLIVPSESLFTKLRDGGKLRKLDRKVVGDDLLQNLAPAFRELASDPGNEYSIPWATGTTGLGYDTTVFAEPPSWDVLLDARYDGRMTVLDEMREAFAAALFLLRFDANTTDASEIAAAEAQLAEIFQHAAADSATYLDRLSSGDLVVAQAFSTDIGQAQLANPNLAFTIPDGKGSRWIDLLCIPEDAANPKGANEFVAFYLDGAISAQNAEVVRIDTGNTAAVAFIAPDVLADPTIYPPDDVLDGLVFLKDLGPANALYEAAWARLRG